MKWLPKEIQTLIERDPKWLWILITTAGIGALLLGVELLTFLVLGQVLLGQNLADLTTGGALLERVLGGYEQSELLILISCVFGGVVIVRAALVLTYQVLSKKWVSQATARLQTEVMESLMMAPTSMFDKRPPGDILHGVMEAPLAVVLAVIGISGFITSISQISLTIIAVGYVSPWLPIGALGILVPMIFLISKPLQRWTRGLKRRHVAERIDATQLATTAIGGIRDIKALSTEDRTVDRFAQYVTRAEKSGLHIEAMKCIPGPTMQVMFQTAFALSIIIMVTIMSAEDMVTYLPYLAAIAYSLLRVYPSASMMVKSRLFLTQAVPDLKVVEEWIAIPCDALAQGTRTAPAQFESIRFDKVSFAYNAENPTLVELDFSIEAGKITSFVGGSGAGKSTIIDLLLKFRSPGAGSIWIGDEDLSEVFRASWLQMLGVVRQDVVFFSGTIRENLLAWRSDASEEDILSACDQAGVLDFISDSTSGLDTVVGDRGVTLSGGQRQRIALARAILRDPQVLILDEALSALDGETESKILESLLRGNAQRTIILVSHRLTTVKNSDHIIVLDRGRVIDQGTHRELLDAGDRYRELFMTQIALAGENVN
jgi:ABC-type multidrug transport system fused ATPase/permease subunit